MIRVISWEFEEDQPTVDWLEDLYSQYDIPYVNYLPEIDVIVDWEEFDIHILDALEENQDIFVVTHDELVFYHIRACIKEWFGDYIQQPDAELWVMAPVGHCVYKIDKDGRMYNWPLNVFDEYEKVLDRLL